MSEEAVVVWRGGVRFEAEARGHRLAIDQPKDEGGRDEGMTPLECLGVSLGSCVAYFVARFAQRHALALEALRVDVTWDYAERPHRVGRFLVRVGYRGTVDALMRERLLAVAQGCTVHHTLTHPPDVSVTLTDLPAEAPG
ncbi:MAG: OsmC family protein [Nitrospirota bacterium]